MRQKMVALWQEVLDAERSLEEGDVDALEVFIHSAGTMIDNHRMAKHMFTRHRVSPNPGRSGTYHATLFTD